MRHQKHKNRLQLKPSHRKSLMRNLASELLDHKRIKTTLPKSKALQPFVEKLITIAKEDNVANRRLAFSRLNNKIAVKNLFEVAAKMKTRPGGYTRIMKLADPRMGDGAKMSLIELVD